VKIAKRFTDAQWLNDSVYHGMNNPWNGWSARTIRAQKFTWDEATGYPVFPRPG